MPPKRWRAMVCLVGGWLAVKRLARCHPLVPRGPRSGAAIMEKRVLLAIFLSFLVLYVYQSFVVKPVPKPANASSGNAAGSPDAAATPQGTATARPASPPVAMPAATALVGDTERARRPHRDARRHRGVHQPRRASEKLAAQAFPRREEGAARARRPRARRHAAAPLLAARGRRGGDGDAERRALHRGRRAETEPP